MWHCNYRPGKFYNIASKYLLAPLNRKRVITAPPMEKLHHRYSDVNAYYRPPPKVLYCSSVGFYQY